MELIPEWSDEKIASKEKTAIREYAINVLGYSSEEMDQVYDYRALLGLRSAWLQSQTAEATKRKPTENISSYEYLLRGKENHHKFTKEACQEALKNFDKAIEADVNNAQAYAWKCCTLGQAMFRGFSDQNPEEIFAEAKQNIDKALELNENDFECHRMLSAVYLSNHDYILAEDHGRKAFNMVPNDPRVLSGYGEVLVRIGKVDKGLELLNKACLL